ncbi:hypothetical protein [Streptomyces sp. NRRL F-4428]|uniref:hypothetical protein n=1 Tax=Streptomyces sp. NRRL F-4428 TaxID=1609137 RepID=UPI000A523A23|nr:hypothetical protein [Streptomyces sp. NRRL F-4428]
MRLVETGVAGVAQLLKKLPERVRTRLAKSTGIKDFAAADCEDLREAVHTLRLWFNTPSAYVPPKRTRIERPTGMGQLLVPRTLKPASASITCGLCADPVKAGDLIGRTRSPKNPKLHQEMGWLCQQCRYERREKPRRRDVLLRIFHHLFASSAVDLNAHECAVLRTWILEDPKLTATAAWQRDPLHSTLARLQTSQEEAKPATGIAFPTTLTILALLRERSASASPAAAADTELLNVMLQHLHEWETNPQKVSAARYGRGPAFRVQVLAVTASPSVLSERGGPFDLHHAPPPKDEDHEDEEGQGEA